MAQIKGLRGAHYSGVGQVNKAGNKAGKIGRGAVKGGLPILSALVNAIGSIPNVGLPILGLIVFCSLAIAARSIFDIVALSNPMLGSRMEWWLATTPLVSTVEAGLAAFFVVQFVGQHSSRFASFFGRATRWNPLMRAYRPDLLIGRLEERYVESPDALLRGDQEEAARERFPAERFSWLYKIVPADIRRPVLMDGRTPDGSFITSLVWRDLTPETVEILAREALANSVRWAAAASLAALAANFVYLMSAGFVVLPPAPPYAGVPWWAGGGGVLDWCWIYAASIFVHGSGFLITAALSLLVVPVLVFMATQRLAMKWMFGRVLAGWLLAASATLRRPTRDALVLWPSRYPERENEIAVFARQVEAATGRLAGSSMIAIGRATGTFRARGCNEAPVKGQMVCMDFESVKQSLMVLGGTGSGKTRLVLKPFARSVLRLASPSQKIGMMVIDGKGVLHNDLLAMPEITERDDVVVVGTEHGMVGIDLVGGMSPLDIATVAETVSTQLMSDGGGFWGASASLLVLHSAALCRVVASDDAMNLYLGVPAYTLAGIYGFATMPPFLVDVEARQIEAILHRVDRLRGELIDDISPELRALVLAPDTAAALKWFRDSWKPMAEQTRSGITAHLDSVFGRFMGSGLLLQTFGMGPRAGSVSVDHALRGGILMVAVGTAGWGAAGHLVTVWLKTLLFMRARQLLQTEREARKNVLCVLLADEYQMLAAASESGSGKDDDSNFWNISRECSVALCAASQSLVALEMAIGDKPAKNLLQQMRSKIFLSTDELATVNFAKEISGKIHRGLIHNQPGLSFYETVASREMALPHVPVDPATITIRNGLPGGLAFSKAAFRTFGLDPVAEVDQRFMVSYDHQKQNIGEHLGTNQAAHWRAEDRARAALTAAEMVDKLTVDDLQLGHGFAFAMIQRAGVDRADILDLRAVLEEQQAAETIEGATEEIEEELV